MPELPEVETVRRGLDAVMTGRRLGTVTVNRFDLRRPIPPDFAERVSGRTVTAIARRGKYLLIEFDDDGVLIVHLGMSGRMVIDPPGATAPETGAAAPTTAHSPHEHVVFEVGNGTMVRFSDPRRFGLMALTDRAGLEAHPLLAHLGPEPVDDDFTGALLAGRLKGKRTPIKAALLDQRVVAGLGNIYVCESLFKAGLSPRRIAATVQGGRAGRLAAAVRGVLADAIAAGGSTLRDHVAPSGEIGYFQHSFKVYGREGAGCPTAGCGAAVRRIVQSGRSTFFCSRCQR
jgi:formamidopyrimidine-DNA glycosylase